MASSNSDRKVSLATFPSSRQEALAILYLQNQDLSGKAPEEIARMYDDAYRRIGSAFGALRDEKKQQRGSRDLLMF